MLLQIPRAEQHKRTSFEPTDLGSSSMIVSKAMRAVGPITNPKAPVEMAGKAIDRMPAPCPSWWALLVCASLGSDPIP